MGGEGAAAPHPEPWLSVVVPAWNEAARIQDCLSELQRCLDHLGPEIIVVDDGSTDGTAAAAQRWLEGHAACAGRLVRVPHGGKGRAVYAGVRQSRGAAVAYIDADLDIPAAEIERLLGVRALAGSDVVVGSKRLLTWRQLPRPALRRAASVAFSGLVGLLFHLPVRDTQTGVKVFPGAWLRAVAAHARVPGFLFDVELLAVAAAEGLRITEVPVAVGMRRPASRIGLGHGWRCLAELGQVLLSVPHVRHALHPERRIPGRAAGVLGHDLPGT